ncbi:hypothetical protein [Zooshikella ganghwensis]|uniref:hypothetical protein n=1 Tax=Zooshikella ganghwensis TaxID=202772 RepID=UPI001058D4F3|nr:hypothetical protein [Zooshikella ganghwensis]
MKCEGKKNIESPSEKQIVKALKSLKSFGPNSFAILSLPSGDFVQVAGGRMTCLLEKKVGSTIYRAYQSNPSTPFPDGTILSFSGGDVAMKNDEWFNIF